MNLKFKVGDTVKLSEVGADYYPNVPEQGMGGRGKVVFAWTREIDMTRPYLVLWDSNPDIPNSYREIDLELVSKPGGYFNYPIQLPILVENDVGSL